MAFPLLFIGLILFITGVTGETQKFSDTVKADLQGDGTSAPFAVWVFAILFIALIGAYKPLRPVSDGFLSLVVLVFVMSNAGLIGEFSRAFGLEPSQFKTIGPLKDIMKP